MAKRNYGWQPDLPDKRDYLFRKVMAPLPAAAKSDLRHFASPIEDQGSLGSCCGNGSVAVLEYNQIAAGKGLVDLSRLFAYYSGRLIEGTTATDSGCQIRDVVKGLATYGVPPESTWPYVISDFAKRPTPAAYSQALPWVIRDYSRVITLNDLRVALTQGHPVVFGFTVHESFESDAVAKTGIMPMPKKNERVLGGHCVVAFGHDDSKKQVICRNSWGPGWGDKGYFYMPYAYISNRNLADDFWVIRG